ncbi:MAG: DHH family phosphoesterase [Candidatus Thorarchaeota archaeon]
MFIDQITFVNKLKPLISETKPNIALAADNDLDGLTSACLMDKMLYEVFDIEPDACFRHELTWNIDWEQLPEPEYQIGFFLDLAYDNTPNYRNIASKIDHAFAIDHHVASETGFPQKVLAYNPCRNSECYIPTIFLVKRVSQTLGLTSDSVNDYLVLLGVLADSGIYFNITSEKDLRFGCSPEIMPFYEEMRSQFPGLFSLEEFEGFTYPKYRNVLAAVEKEASELGWAELNLQFINESGDLGSLQGLIEQIHKKHEGEFEQLLAELPSEPTETSSSGIWILRNTTSIPNGALARTIAEMTTNPIVVYKCAKMCYIAARAPHNSSINFIPAFKTFGGGHEGACGAYIPSKDLEEFLAKIRSL